MISLPGGIGKLYDLGFLNSLKLCLVYHSQVFPNHSSARRPICKNSALARIKEKCSELQAISANPIQQ
jgi:hypothetical protein